MTVIWECPWSLQSSALFNGPAQTILSPNISEFKFHPPYYRCRSPFVGLFYNSGPDLQITLGPFSNSFSLNSPLISCPKKQRRCMKLDPKWKWAILCSPNLAKLNIRDWAFKERLLIWGDSNWVVLELLQLTSLYLCIDFVFVFAVIFASSAKLNKFFQWHAHPLVQCLSLNLNWNLINSTKVYFW